MIGVRRLQTVAICFSHRRNYQLSCKWMHGSCIEDGLMKAQKLLFVLAAVLLPAQVVFGRAGGSMAASASMSAPAPTGVRPIRARITIRAPTIQASIRICTAIPSTIRRRSSLSRPRPRSISSRAMSPPSRSRMQPSNTGISARVPANITPTSRSVRVAGRRFCRNRHNKP